jgi:hypothetical protein
LNRQALEWCKGQAAERRCPEDRTMTVAQAFELEKQNLLALPANPFPVYEKEVVRVGKTPYVRFDLNDYSTSYKLAKKTVQVVADLETVRIMDGLSEVACHKRSWDKGCQIENPQHIEELQERKKEAKKHRGMNRLAQEVPASTELLKMAAERGQNLGGLTSGLLCLLDLYGACELELAVKEAVAGQAVHLAAVRQVLERRRREQDLPEPVAIAVPDDPRIKSIVLTPPNLAAYDRLHTAKEESSHE